MVHLFSLFLLTFAKCTICLTGLYVRLFTIKLKTKNLDNPEF